MKVFKSAVVLLLTLCMLFALCACSAANTDHPPKYEKLSALLASPMDTFLSEMKLKEEQLTETQRGLYLTPLTVDFYEIPFTISVQEDTINDYFCAFQYTADFGTDAKAFSEAVCHVAKAMAESFGAAQISSAGPDPDPLAELTAAELETELAGLDLNDPSSGWRNRDSWGLEEINSKNMETYLSILQASGNKLYNQPPVLLLTLSANTTLQGTYEITITYQIVFGWLIE